MNSIITDKSSIENALSSKIDNFFSKHAIYKLMKSSNFYKESGFQPVEILKQLFRLVFSGKNLYRTLDMNGEDVAFKKNTAYRFLNSSRYNWSKLLLLLHCKCPES